MKMKALVYEGPKELNIRDIDRPEPGPEEVLIGVHTTGICGSELSGYLGKNSLRVPPLVMGHEFSGNVAEIGDRVTKFRIGDRVTANPLISCGNCSSCNSGNPNLCQHRKLIGAHQSGSYAEYVVVPKKNVYLLPDKLSMSDGALVEPFACGVHLSRMVQMDSVDKVLIMGAGPIGLFVLRIANILGVGQVVVQEINKERLKIVEELGGIPVSSPDEMENYIPGRGFDIGVDAVGLEKTRQQCLKSVKPGGSIIFSGLHSADSQLPGNLIVRNELKILGSFAYNPDDFGKALEWLAKFKSKITPWIYQAPLHKGSECFEKLISNPGAIAKILLTVN